MHQLDVTDDQLAYLESVRATLESEYLGPYGHVTTQDALQFLIDVHESTDPDLPSVDGGAVEGGGLGAGDPGVEATNGVATETPDPEDPAEQAGDAAEEVVETDDADDADDLDDADGTDDTKEGDDESEASDEESDGGEDETGTEADASDGADEDGSSFDEDTGDNDRLQAMMNLLETHDDKWREGDGEARYEIDLPDGSTETVQTRDDVRAVLFKNYR